MIDVHVRSHSQSASLAGAILLYGGDSHEEAAFATVHKVDGVNGRPTVMPGRLLLQSDLAAMMRGFSNARSALETVWLDARVLAKGPDRMIWWSPAGKRPMFFEASSHNNKTFSGGAVCPVPPMVWMAIQGEGLFVFACKADSRPALDTQLYQAPLFNIWGRGKVCWGNAKPPQVASANDPEAWEQALFGSRFTHPNFTEKGRLIKRGTPTSFWSRMVTGPAETFPLAQLVTVPLKVGDLLDRDIVAKLNAWPKPKGEF